MKNDNISNYFKELMERDDFRNAFNNKPFDDLFNKNNFEKDKIWGNDMSVHKDLKRNKVLGISENKNLFIPTFISPKLLAEIGKETTPLFVFKPMAPNKLLELSIYVEKLSEMNIKELRLEVFTVEELWKRERASNELRSRLDEQ